MAAMGDWIELTCRWILGLQLTFWGLNGFFHWMKIPPSDDFITRFGDLCFESKFIMPTVKIFEILFGIALLTGWGTMLSLIMLGPIVFVISGLHLFHNKKWWEVLIPISLPYLILVVLNISEFQVLLH
jgi:uncharacterized membrane protein YphA (DoxX/SURF4 family)